MSKLDIIATARMRKLSVVAILLSTAACSDASHTSLKDRLFGRAEPETIRLASLTEVDSGCGQTGRGAAGRSASAAGVGSDAAAIVPGSGGGSGGGAGAAGSGSGSGSSGAYASGYGPIGAANAGGYGSDASTISGYDPGLGAGGGGGVALGGGNGGSNPGNTGTVNGPGGGGTAGNGAGGAGGGMTGGGGTGMAGGGNGGGGFFPVSIGNVIGPLASLIRGDAANNTLVGGGASPLIAASTLSDGQPSGRLLSAGAANNGQVAYIDALGRPVTGALVQADAANRTLVGGDARPLVAVSALSADKPSGRLASLGAANNGQAAYVDALGRPVSGALVRVDAANRTVVGGDARPLVDARTLSNSQPNGRLASVGAVNNGQGAYANAAGRPVSSLVRANAANQTVVGRGNRPLVAASALSATQPSGRLASLGAANNGQAAYVDALGRPVSGALVRADAGNRTVIGGGTRPLVDARILSSSQPNGRLASVGAANNGQGAYANAAGRPVSSLVRANAANQTVVGRGNRPLVAASALSATQPSGRLASVGAANNGQAAYVDALGRPVSGALVRADAGNRTVVGGGTRPLVDARTLSNRQPNGRLASVGAANNGQGAYANAAGRPVSSLVRANAANQTVVGRGNRPLVAASALSTTQPHGRLASAGAVSGGRTAYADALGRPVAGVTSNGNGLGGRSSALGNGTPLIAASTGASNQPRAKLVSAGAGNKAVSNTVGSGARGNGLATASAAGRPVVTARGAPLVGAGVAQSSAPAARLVSAGALTNGRVATVGIGQ